MNTFIPSILFDSLYLYNSDMKKLIFITSCTIYFCSSIFINLFGQLSVSMMDTLNMNRTDIAMILTFEALGGLFTSVFLGIYGERYDKLKTIIAATMIMSAGTMSLVLTNGSKELLMVFIFLMIANIGYIAIDLTMNSMIAERYKDKKNYLLPIIHIFYGLGAMAAPLFVMFCSRRFSNGLYGKTYLLLGAITALLGAMMIFAASHSKKTENIRQLNDPLEIFRQRKAWHFLLTAIFYAMFQTGISSWLSDYNISHLHMTPERSGMIISLYFSFALVMRLLSTLILRKISAYRYYRISGILASISLFTAVIADDISLYPLFLILAGFFSGGMVPSFMIIVTDYFPTRQSSSTSIFVFAVCISNLFAPVFGKIIEKDTHDAAMCLIGACLFISAVLIRNHNERKDKHE